MFNFKFKFYKVIKYGFDRFWVCKHKKSVSYFLLSEIAVITIILETHVVPLFAG